MDNVQLDLLTQEYQASGMSYARARGQARHDLQALTKAQQVGDKSEPQTFHSKQANEPKAGGRFANLPEAKGVVITTGLEYPRLPASSPWAERQPDAYETADTSHVEPVGEIHEQRASLPRSVLPSMSADRAAGEGPTTLAEDGPSPHCFKRRAD